jgi:predicted nucleic acid-binding protein
LRLVVAGTGPVNYLILIGHPDVLPALFEKVILPSTVQSELAARKAPAAVRQWIAEPPAWVETRDAPASAPDDASLKISTLAREPSD